MKEDRKIYVRLLDEGLDVWKPIDARMVGENVFQISDQPYDSDLETWEFEPGDFVFCKARRFDEDRVLIAMRRLKTSNPKER